MKKIVAVGAMVSLLSGCASVPEFYPNAKYQQVGKAGADMDIKECDQKADVYLDSPEAKKILKGAGTGAVVGGAVGAVAGLFTGNFWRSAAAGAAIGGTAGGVSGALSPNELKRRFVVKCLQDKGYDVIGWS